MASNKTPSEPLVLSDEQTVSIRSRNDDFIIKCFRPLTQEEYNQTFYIKKALVY